MKFVKLSMFALAMGLFVASCGSETHEEEVMEADTAMMAPEAMPAPVDTIMASPVDTVLVDTVTAQ